MEEALRSAAFTQVTRGGPGRTQEDGPPPAGVGTRVGAPPLAPGKASQLRTAPRARHAPASPPPRLWPTPAGRSPHPPTVPQTLAGRPHSPPHPAPLRGVRARPPRTPALARASPQRGQRPAAPAGRPVLAPIRRPASGVPEGQVGPHGRHPVPRSRVALGPAPTLLVRKGLRSDGLSPPCSPGGRGRGGAARSGRGGPWGRVREGASGGWGAGPGTGPPMGARGGQGVGRTGRGSCGPGGAPAGLGAGLRPGAEPAGWELRRERRLGTGSLARESRRRRRCSRRISEVRGRGAPSRGAARRAPCSSCHLRPQAGARHPFPAPAAPLPRGPMRPCALRPGAAGYPRGARAPVAASGRGFGDAGARAGATGDAKVQVYNWALNEALWPFFASVRIATEDAPRSPFPLRVLLHKHRSHAQAWGGGCRRDGGTLGLRGFEMKPLSYSTNFRPRATERAVCVHWPRMYVILWR